MANEFTSDGQYIFINTPYAEAYIPEEVIDSTTTEDDDDSITASKIAYSTGDSFVCIGVFYMKFFDSDENIAEKRLQGQFRTLNYPNRIETYPSDEERNKVLEINGQIDKFRILKYYEQDILMAAASKKSYINTEMYTKMVMSGKLPKSLSYDDLYFSWLKSFDINGINPGIPPVLMQAIIAKMTRLKDDVMTQYRFEAGKRKVDPYGYRMLSMNQVSAYSSAMSSMAFERFGEKLTTSIIMTKEGIKQEPSPIEKLITI